MPDARELAQVLVEAEDIARRAGHPLTSVHLLLGLWAAPCPAASVLEERGVDAERLLAAMPGPPREAASIAGELLARTREIAAGLGAEAGSLHLLIAISRHRDALAHDLLERCGVPLAPLRNTMLSWFTGGRIPRNHLVAQALSTPSPPAAAPRAPRGPAAPPRTLEDWEVFPTPGRRGAGSTSRPDAAGPAEDSAPPRAAARLDAEAGEAAAGAPRAGAEGLRPPDANEARRPTVGAGSSHGARPVGGDDATRRIPSALTRPGAPPRSASAHDLDPERFPLLTSFGRNLTAAAAAGRLDPVIGRDREIDQVVDVLGKRRGNNPVLVGEAGVGKTAVVEGVAARLLGDPHPPILVELDMASLVAGTALRGSFSERLGGIKDEVRCAEGRVLVFIDELHTVVGAGSSGEGPQDAANELKTALARGEFPCIGATTHEEYRRFIAADPALERRFTPVEVAEPTIEQTVSILRGLAPRYEQHHGVRYDAGALRAAATLTARHVRERKLPDKAIQAIDLAGSRCRRAGKEVVDGRAIAEVVAATARIPVERLVADDAERLLRLEAELSARVVGHGDVIERVAGALRRNYAGFASRRPMGSFLFLGPTGVGKTELAKAIADVLFGSEDALTRVDMSEMAEAQGVARLIGAPPGYVGHGEGGQLTEAIRRRPASVVLLDEIEKAHRDVQLLLLQILDEGHLTDSSGRQVSFAQSVVVLTSNLGAEVFTPGRGAAGPVGFAAPAATGQATDARSERALSIARERLPLELWNRIDERCLFLPLGREEIASIARLLVADSARRLRDERGIRLEVADEAILALVDAGGFDQALGARPMRQAIQRLVEAPLADAILRGELAAGDTAVALPGANCLEFRHQRAPAV